MDIQRFRPRILPAATARAHQQDDKRHSTLISLLERDAKRKLNPQLVPSPPSLMVSIESRNLLKII